MFYISQSKYEKKSFNIPKGFSHATNRRTINNTMVKRTRTNYDI